MPIVKNEFPILEYDTGVAAIIEPEHRFTALAKATEQCGNKAFPPLCLITFMRDALHSYIEKHGAEQIGSYDSETQSFPIYRAVIDNTGIGGHGNAAEAMLMHVPVGSGAAAIAVDYLIGLGARKIIACGGCGVLADIRQGSAIVASSALRDEGASYHYLPPSRTITPDRQVISALHATLTQHGVAYQDCMIWTTDGFFRETPDMVAYRKQEGCQAVDMECAAMAAVAQFRSVAFGQLFYSGDILLDAKGYDDRSWIEDLDTREKLFYLALQALASLA